jgi:hypothetical protein
VLLWWLRESTAELKNNGFDLEFIKKEAFLSET